MTAFTLVLWGLSAPPPVRAAGCVYLIEEGFACLWWARMAHVANNNHFGGR